MAERRSRRSSASLVLIVASMLAAPSAQAQSGQPSRAWSIPSTERGPAEQAFSRRRNPAAPVGLRIELLPPPARALPLASKTRLQIGSHRRLPGAVRTLDGAELTWEPAVAGGVVTTVAVRSAGAQALRLAARFDALPGDVQVRFYPPGAERAVDGVYDARLLRDARAPAGRPAASGRAAGEERVRPVWSPVVSGDEIVMELWSPRVPERRSLRLRLYRVAHLSLDPGGARDLAHIGNSQACEVDAACDPKWLELGDAVAKIVFESGESSFLCTGQLVAQTGKRQKPFFLTAAHCISEKAEAASTTFYWFFRRAECGGADPTAVTQTGGGARRIFTTGAEDGTSTTDHTLLKLRRSPPDGTALAGWTLDGPDDLAGRKVRGLHHPAGDLLMSSRGRLTGQARITWRPGGTFLVQFVEPSTHYQVTWNRGVTEGGSSGSGLYVGKRWPKQYLVGLLSGGLAFCSAPQDPDFYGRFDLTFQDNAKVRRKLDPAKQFSHVDSTSGR